MHHHRKDPPTQEETQSLIGLTIFLGLAFLLVIYLAGWLCSSLSQWLFDL